MAQDTQIINIVGRLGSDPESRFTASGTQVTSFSVACNNRDGNTTWYRVSAFGKLGEICNEYLTKGKQVFIGGDLTIRTYDKKDGGSGVSYDVSAHSMQMLGGKRDESESTPAPQRAQAPRNAPTKYDEVSEDLPF